MSEVLQAAEPQPAPSAREEEKVARLCPARGQVPRLCRFQLDPVPEIQRAIRLHVRGPDARREASLEARRHRRVNLPGGLRKEPDAARRLAGRRKQPLVRRPGRRKFRA